MNRTSRREFFKMAAGSLAITGLEECRKGPAGNRIITMVKPGAIQPERESTDYLIIHCTHDKKDVYKTANDLMLGAKAHYLIARDGTLIRIVPDSLVANHAGASRWNSIETLNYHSIGVEFDGMNYEPYTTEQYEAFRELFLGRNGLKERYNISDKNVLFHSQVAYCKDGKEKGCEKPMQRGRKCDPGFIFNRKAAGIGDSPIMDSDVEKGDLAPSPTPAKLVIYPQKRELAIMDFDGVQYRKVLSIPVAIDARGPDYVPKGKFLVSDKGFNPFASRHGLDALGVSREHENKIAFSIQGLAEDNALDRFYSNFGPVIQIVYPKFADRTRGSVSPRKSEMEHIYMNVIKGMQVEVR